MGDLNSDLNLNKFSQSLFSVFENSIMNFVIGKDTNSMSEKVEKTLAEGLKNLGANVFLLGVTCASALSYAIKLYKATAGIMISCDENNVYFKIFNGNSFPITQEQISALEYRYKNLCAISPKYKEGRIFSKPFFNEEYVEYLSSIVKFSKRKKKPKILADLSLGSACEIYPIFCEIFDFENYCVNSNREGVKLEINFEKNFIVGDCKKQTVCDYFVKFNGDCSKVYIYDKNLKQFSTDLLLAMFAKREQEKLGQSKVVTTIYTNNKVFEYFDKEDIIYQLILSPQESLVEKMMTKKINLGADFDGIILLDYFKIPDAFLTLVLFLDVVINYSHIFKQIKNLPINFQKQTILNFEIDKKNPEFETSLSKLENELNGVAKIVIQSKNFLNKTILLVESENKTLCDEAEKKLVEILTKFKK